MGKSLSNRLSRTSLTLALIVPLSLLGCGGGGDGGGSATSTSGGSGGSGSSSKGGSSGSSSSGKGGSSGGSASGGSSGEAGSSGSGGTGTAGAPGAGGDTSGGAGASGTGGSGTSPGAGGTAATGGSTGQGGSPTPGPDAGPTTDGGPPSSGGGCDYMDDKQFCTCLKKSCGANTFKDSKGAIHAAFCGGGCAEPLTCLGEADVAGGAAGVCSMIGGLSAAQKKAAEELTNIWEYSQTTLDVTTYAQSENIKDHRGYTNGRAGFCTATGDAILVIACYNQAKPGNVMMKYMPPLLVIEKAFLDRNGALDPDVLGSQKLIDAVGNWKTDWKTSAQDAVFRKCQDDISEAVYYAPAIKHATDKGFTTALTKAALYDAQINQGEADPKTGVKAMMAKADAMAGMLSSPPTRDQESAWLGAFLKIRAQVMYDDAATWRGDMFRTAEYEKLRKDGNFDLTGCINIGTVSASQMWPGSGFTTGKAGGAKVGACN